MPVISDAEQLIGLPRIALLLGISHPTAKFWASEGRFPVVRIDGRMYARTDDVLRYRADRDRMLREKRARGGAS